MVGHGGCGLPCPDPGPSAAPVRMSPLPGLLWDPGGGVDNPALASASSAGTVLGSRDCCGCSAPSAGIVLGSRGCRGVPSSAASVSDHSSPYSSFMTAFHNALSWRLVVAVPSRAAVGRMPSPLRHCNHACQRISAGRATSPSRIASSNDFSLPLTCLAISGFKSVVTENQIDFPEQPPTAMLVRALNNGSPY